MIDIDKIIRRIPDESENMTYVADPQNHDLIYMNQAACRNYQVDYDLYRGQKCYQLLQGLDEPCSFCTNRFLNTKNYYIWKHHNKKLDQHYMIRDKLIEVDGRLLRLEICTDITDVEQMNVQLQNQAALDETLVCCIQTLSSGNDSDEAINKLLSIIGEYYSAKRTYIFEFNYKQGLVRNSYEWCDDKTTSQIDNLQTVPIEACERWLEHFKSNDEFFITSVGTNLDKESIEYQILEPQGIESLMAAPLKNRNGKIAGFIGVDDPRRHTDSIQLIKSMTYFIQNDLAKRKMMEQLWTLSYTDRLTGLGNRNSYIELVEELDRNPPNSMGVVFVDINGLKKANDTYGHQYGDRMICSVAEGIKACFPESSYRIGGDEFISFLLNQSREEFEQRVMQLRRFEKQHELCGFSIGMNWNEGEIKASEQVGYSDSQMYAEKQRYYIANPENRLHRSGKLSRELFEAIDRHEFLVVYQPKVDLRHNRIVGAEALIRKKGKEGELIKPDYFIPIYEAEGIIRHIDFFVLNEVCRQLQQWRQQGIQNELRISVNFSRVTLMEHDIPRKLCEVLTHYQIEPSRIVIEVTESINKIDSLTLKELAEQLHQCGFLISLDDFGSQYSSLSTLTAIDFDELKFDKSMVDPLTKNAKARIVLMQSLELCRVMNIGTVAEGIEREEQLDMLKSFQCDLGQGYYFSRPISPEEMLQMIKDEGGFE